MKFKNKIYSILFIAAFGIISACEKNVIAPLQSEVGNQAKLAIVNAVPAAPAAPLTALPPTIDVFANDTKINGNALGYTVRFPTIQYSLLTPGNSVIKTIVNTPAVIPTPVIAPNIPFGTELSSNSFNFLANKNYTLFVTGVPRGATVGVVIEDVFPLVTSLKAHIKFVNVMPDGGNVDLFSGVIPTGSTVPATSTALFSNIARNTGSEYIAIDVVEAGTSYQFQLRVTTGGATAGVPFNLTVLPGRLYTFYARGFNTTYTIPGFTPARTVVAAPGLSLITNR